MTEEIKMLPEQVSASKCIASILLLCGAIVMFVFVLTSEIGMLNRVFEEAALISVRSVVPPLIFMMPAFIVLIVGIYDQMKQRASVQKQKIGMVIIVSCFILFFLVWVTYHLKLMSWLAENEYSKCQWYSGATLGASIVTL